ncbi:MAG: glycosyltransferase family 39 protein, partial [Tepidisphaeraceae bacterium]
MPSIHIERTAGPIWTRAIGPVIVAAVGVFMLRWTWLTWPDPIVDYGRELYVPWRLSEGDVLYRDIEYFNGPLSPYLDALLFCAFGVGLRTLVWFNVLNIALITALIYHLVGRCTDRWAATTGAIVFLTLFAFAQFGGVGNYNYVCPSSYELTHGIALSLAALACVGAYARSGGAGWAAGAGGLLGLVFLTKAEVFLAALAAVGAAMLICARFSRRWRHLLLMGAVAILPPLVALILLLRNLSLPEALDGLAGSWKWIGDRNLTGLPFFRRISGTRDLGQSLQVIAIGGATYGLIVLCATAAARALHGRPLAARVLALTCLVAIPSLGWRLASYHVWDDFVRPAPMLLGVTLAVLGRELIRRRDDSSGRHRLALSVALCIFAMVMLLKVFFNAHIYHYGFALAMPATMALVGLLVGWMPARAQRIGAEPWLPRAVGLAVLIAVAGAYLPKTRDLIERKTNIVASGADKFYADRTRGAVREVVRHINFAISPSATLVAIPEG